MGSIYRYLDSVGDGTGDTDVTGDYSGAAQDFGYAPGSGTLARIERMIVSVEDSGGMQAQEYGNLGAALTNGIEVLKLDTDANTLLDLTAGIALKTNAQWGVTCFDADIKGWGSGNDLLVVRWTFAKSGAPLTLDGNNAERLVVRVNDDLRNLIHHRFMIQGTTQ